MINYSLRPMIGLCLPAVLFLSGCASGMAPGRTIPPDSTEATNTPYVIGPGDVLNVFVYRAPELSVTDLPVRPDGRISLPLIPDIVAIGRTPTQLSAELQEKLKQYLVDPNVTVMVHSFVGPLDRQIRVIGEAAEPMAIPYRNGMTLLDVMIQTKGLTRFAAGNRAVVVRRLPTGGQQVVRVRLSDLIKDGDITENVPMDPGDTLIIPQSWF